MKEKTFGFDTRAIHSGHTGHNPEKALNPPIFMTSTFTFDSIQDVQDVMAFKSTDYVYTRGNNPTLRLFENRIADLEHAAGAVSFSSGMGAISSALFSLLSPGDTVIAHRTLYGSSHSVVTKLLPKYHVRHKIIDLTQPQLLEQAIDESVKVIYFETPSNPNLEIIDISAVTTIAKRHGIKTIVDNTFSTPYVTRPLDLGVDVVVHSATKYLCGHGDVVAGAAAANDREYLGRLKFDYMCEFGSALSPFNAWLLLRGMKTLGVRMRQHMANAEQIAAYLESHPMVEKVFYPGLPGFPGHEAACRQMEHGFGAIISFEVKGGLSAATQFVNSVRLASLAVSLGDCETLIELPAAMTHVGYDHERLLEFGLTESMVRISVGLEDVEDIIADLDQAFDAAAH